MTKQELKRKILKGESVYVACDKEVFNIPLWMDSTHIVNCMGKDSLIVGGLTIYPLNTIFYTYEEALRHITEYGDSKQQDKDTISYLGEGEYDGT